MESDDGEKIEASTGDENRGRVLRITDYGLRLKKWKEGKRNRSTRKDDK